MLNSNKIAPDDAGAGAVECPALLLLLIDVAWLVVLVEVTLLVGAQPADGNGRKSGQSKAALALLARMVCVPVASSTRRIVEVLTWFFLTTSWPAKMMNLSVSSTG